MPKDDMSNIHVRSKGAVAWVKAHPARTAVVAVVIVAVLGIAIRLENRFMLRRASERQSVPTVAVTKASTAPRGEDLVLPGNVEAFVSAPIYARTSGYLKRWLVDIGTPVKAGQVLAEIDTPEVDQQLVQAQADLRTAEANETLSRSTAERWQALLKTDSVSKQEADEKSGDLASKQAQTAAARANLQRLHDLQNFQRLVAPFDGTITARNTDVGQLVSNGSGTELFHIADLRKLRVYAQVPQPYAPRMQKGLAADLVFAERPDEKFPASVVRTADALDPASRTLLVELQVDNAKGELFPGSYCEVHFKVPSAANVVRVPANALIFRGEGTMIATVRPDNHVAINKVTIGRDFGTELEVVAGLAPGASVIVSPPDSLQDGAQVRVVAAKTDQTDGNKAPQPPAPREADKK
jgi:RND family efflux transporter MFP subunit